MAVIWVVVPAFNEAQNLAEVVPAIIASLSRLQHDYHVVVVDDGSRDETTATLAQLGAEHRFLSSIRLRINQGKASALRRGFGAALEADATWIVMMDADGQDDPDELPRMIAELEAGRDLVTGARGKRNDRFVKRFTSRFYNRVTGIMSGAPGTDFNSGYKAMTRDVAESLIPTLYGELHRYITVIAHWRGFVVSEVQVNHQARLHGRSKYGLARFWRGFIDLVTIRFLMSYEQRPSHLFSGVGLVTAAVGAGVLLVLLIEKLGGASIGDRPLLIAGVLLFLSGQQLVIFGLLAELVVYRSQRNRSWTDEH
jgi:glycosyltransferase involved in cell wall biosynthesis